MFGFIMFLTNFSFALKRSMIDDLVLLTNENGQYIINIYDKIKNRGVSI